MISADEKWAEIQSFYSLSRSIKFKRRPSDKDVQFLFESMNKFKGSVSRLLLLDPHLEGMIHKNYEKKYGR
jgi:hypothetical protein